MSVGKVVHSASRRVLLRADRAAWPVLAFYLGAWPAALAGEWTAVWLFVFSGSVLAWRSVGPATFGPSCTSGHRHPTLQKSLRARDEDVPPSGRA